MTVDNKALQGAKQGAKDKFNPDHYQKHGEFEPIFVIEAYFQDDAHLAMACKYLLRFGGKAGESQIDDLKKAQWWVGRRVSFLGPKIHELILTSYMKRITHYYTRSTTAMDISQAIEALLVRDLPECLLCIDVLIDPPSRVPNA